MLNVVLVEPEIPPNCGNIARSCEAKYETSVEGECSTTPANPGITSCLEAADCRNGDCKWAACTLRQAGEYNWLRYQAAMLACGAVFDTEIVICLPKQILK